MRILMVALFALIMASCQTNETTNPKPVEVDQVEVTGKDVTLWATYYYAKAVKAVAVGVPLRDMGDKVIGPKLDSNTWCLAAIEGTVIIDGQTYNYAGTKSPAQAKCPMHRPSEKVRWVKSKFAFGAGNKSNALIPFKSIACDQSIFKFGQKFFIPEAKGVKLPDGTSHNGIFECGDVGGAIKGNHIDVFIGAIEGGNTGAMKVNPFSFIKSRSSGTFKAILID